MTPRQAMINTAVVLLVIGVAWLLLQIREILIILILAITFAATIAPIITWLRSRGLSQGQSIIAIYASVLLVIGGLGYLIVPPLASQGATFLDDIPEILQNLEDQARQSDSRFLRTSGARAIDQVGRRYDELRADPSPVGETAIQYVDTVASLIFGVFTVFIVTYYWTTQRALVKRLSLGLVPLPRRERAFRIWDEIEERLGGWARGQLVLSGVIGGVSTAGYWLLGLDFWLTLGIIAGVTEVIPFIGPIIGGGLAVIVALTDSPEKALLTLAFVIVLQQLEGAVLVPRVMRNAVGLNPLSVILAVLVGGTVLGPLGAVIAIPLAAALQVLVANLWEERDDRPDVEFDGPRLDEEDTSSPGRPVEASEDATEGQEDHAAHIRTL